MADIPNRNNRDTATRIIKTNSFAGKGSDVPDSRVSGLRNVSPAQNAGVGSPSSSNVTSNHHPVSHVQHHQNHRSYYPRGRFRNEGGYYGGYNHFGGYHSNLNRRTPPLVPGPPYPKMLVDFMMKEWNDFAAHYRDTRGADLDDWIMVQSGHQQNQQQPMAPTSPRAGSHMNSPHRGQHTRYNHQSSSGANWCGNSGANGRKFPENGDHSGMGSLRRHHNHRGGGHASSALLQNNQSWQRGTLANRQNSPNNTLNRSTGSRHHFQSRPIVSPTPPPAVSATVATSLATEASGKSTKASFVPVAEIKSLSLKPANAAKSTSNASTIDKENSTELAGGTAATPSDAQAKKKAASSMTRDEAVALSATVTVSNVKNNHQQQQQVPMVKHEHPTRRRAATTQGSCLSTSTLAILPLSSSLPATRTSETALVASSSFCSLVDQVDAMSSADQFFTPEPPSSPSSASASLPVAVMETSQQPAVVPAVKVAFTGSPPSFTPTPAHSPATVAPTNGR